MAMRVATWGVADLAAISLRPDARWIGRFSRSEVELYGARRPSPGELVVHSLQIQREAHK